MNPTIQAYTFNTQDELDAAIIHLAALSSDDFDLLEADGPLSLKVWFSDTETVMVAFIEAAFPVVNE